MKKIVLSLTAILSASFLFSQEALKSTEEEYYDFLSLQGLVERPTLGYRTLSDSEWKFIEKEVNEDGNPLTDEAGNKLTNLVMPDHPWKKNNLGTKRTLWQGEKGKNCFTRGFDHSLKLKIYGPEWYNSFNTAAPYGQNDGALWQGKGYNSSLTGGARLEAYGFEVTLKPQVSFSQNMAFDLMDNSAYYTNKYAYIWGYGNNIGVDAPQRFGDSAFWNFDWGDTEIRYSWRTFTIGFGTQSPWVGPAWLNPILHSNNAATYPKFDFGLRRTKVYLPFCNWYIGDIEGRIWMGYLTESDYFDNDSSNDHNRINGFNFSYAPSFIPGLSIGLTKVCLSKWNSFDIKYMNPFYDTNGGIGEKVGEDQKASIYADWICKKIGFEIYGELGIDDYFKDGWIRGLVRYPFNTTIWTIGLKKSINFSEKHSIKGEIILELSDWEEPRTRIIGNEVYAFNCHHQITQGYTNKGQSIGSALGVGGNSQLLRFNLYYPKGLSSLQITHINPDTTFSYIHKCGYDTAKGILVGELETEYYLLKNLRLNACVAYSYITNPYFFEIDENNNPKKDSNNSEIQTGTMHNFTIKIGAKYNF